MSRISKRSNTAIKPAAVGQSAKLYKVAIYARLSSDQDKNINNSELANKSAKAQVDIAISHMNFLVGSGERMELHGTYMDLGKTGTNFNRDEFARMMQDIRMGEINCVIVKDLSRFGRNYMEAGNYIEKIFPFLDVRFIAVSDGFDTGLKGNNNKSMIMNIKNLVNDMYANDVSKKAKIHLEQRRKQGSYVGGPTPYGYTYEWVKTDSIKKKKLIIEPETRPIVELIFDLFIQEKNYDAVTRQMNSRCINPPSVYRKTNVVFCPESEEYKGWNKDGVKRILHSATYIGTLVQGKTSMKGRSEANRVRIDESDWIVIKNSHEAIISKDNFDKAQSIIKAINLKSQSRNSYSDRLPLPENIFDGVLFCGLCGRKLTRHSNLVICKNGDEKRLEYYECLAAYKVQAEKNCQSNRISKESLLDTLFSVLRTEFSAYLKKPMYYIEENEKLGHQRKIEYEDSIRKISQKTERMEADELDLYSRFRSGEIGQEKYVKTKLKNSYEKESLEKYKKDMEARVKDLDREIGRQNRALRNMLKLNQSFEPTKELIDSFVDKIYLYPDKRVEIAFSFTHRNEFEAWFRMEELS